MAIHILRADQPHLAEAADQGIAVAAFQLGQHPVFPQIPEALLKRGHHDGGGEGPVGGSAERSAQPDFPNALNSSRLSAIPIQYQVVSSDIILPNSCNRTPSPFDGAIRLPGDHFLRNTIPYVF
jgi:hypothetical protein